MLKEKQKELEDQANLLNKQNEASEKESKDALLFKTDLPPLHRKQSTATNTTQTAGGCHTVTE